MGSKISKVGSVGEIIRVGTGAERTTKLLAQLLAVSVCFLCIPSCSPATSAAIMAVAVSLAQLIRSRSTRMVRKKPGEALRRNVVTPFAVNGAASVSKPRETAPASETPRTGGRAKSSHGGGRLRLEATSRGVGATAVALAASPNTPGSVSETMENSLEGAITRLAGAAELGTEPLIYVRREDVAEVVDAFVHHARTPGGLTGASPVLARLTIMRRSRRRDVKSRRSPICSPEFRVHDGKRARPAGPAPSPAYRSDGRRPSPGFTASPSARGGVPETGARALFKENIEPAGNKASLTVPNEVSMAMATARALSPVNGASRADDSPGMKKVWGGQDSELRRWCHTRSPPPSRSSVPASSPRPPSTPICRTPIALSRNASPVGMTVNSPAVSGRRPSSAISEKIMFVPVSPRVTGKGAAFDDFWSSGLG